MPEYFTDMGGNWKSRAKEIYRTTASQAAHVQFAKSWETKFGEVRLKVISGGWLGGCYNRTQLQVHGAGYYLSATEWDTNVGMGYPLRA